MPGKSVILTIIAAALFFGGMISGCNRNRDNRVASNDRRHPREDDRRRGPGSAAPRGVRPAEVLSASVKRAPANRQYSSAPALASAAPSYNPQRQRPMQPARRHAGPPHTQQPIYTVSTSKIHEPLPEPIPVPNAPVYAGPVMYAGPVYHGAESPVPASDPYVLDLVPMTSTPELALARATLEPIQAPAAYMPQTQPIQTQPPMMRQEPVPVQRAPLPELEPVRYHRVAGGSSGAPQAVPAMMSTGPARWDGRDHQEVRRALAPLAQPAASTDQNWVSSPATAFRF